MRLILSLLAVSLTPLVAAPITFPDDGGVLSVLDFGATPNDEKDDTAAIQEALDQHPNGNRIVYLPPGKYLISDTLKWPAGKSGGHAHKRTILQGAGENLSILSLPKKTKGFGKGEAKAMIWTGSKPAQRFRNAVRDLTLGIAEGNPGAIGLQFNASNQGCIRNLTGDGSPEAKQGILNRRQLYLRDVEITGYQTSVNNADKGPDDAPVVVIARMCYRSDGMRIEHHSERSLVVSSSIGFKVDGHGTGDIFLDDLAGHLSLYNPARLPGAASSTPNTPAPCS